MDLFYHTHPFKPFIPENATKLIVGTLPPPRFTNGTLKIERNDNLYEVWQEMVTDSLNNDLADDELFLNLASNEYFKVVDSSNLKVPVISPVFKDFKNGKLKIISFYAKKARGSMVRYAIDNNCKTLDDIKGFDYDDYRYSEEHTEKKSEPTFIR